MRNEKHIIKCPYCGAEYLPSEIFFSDDFLPNVKDVVRDENGHIISYRENAVNLEEEYCCDVCNHTFKAVATVGFSTEKCEEHNFDNDYTSKLYERERVELSED